MRARLGWLCWLVLVAACIWLPWHALFEGSGPFVRQLSRSLAWKSLAECLLLFGSVYGSLRLRRGGVWLAVACAEVYARRHGVDITLVMLAAYLAGIHALGRCFAGILSLHGGHALDIHLRDTVLGVVLWSAIIWIVSVTGTGSLSSLRILTFTVVGVALLFSVWRWRSEWVWPERPTTRAGTMLLAAFVATTLMLSAKAAASVDSDALWYGLNADRVLFGEGGLFGSQGLVAHVHFYPKLTEALQAPFLGLGSASLVTGFSLVCWALLALTVRAVFEELSVPGCYAWFGALLACAVPAVAASAATPKGELLGAWLCLSGVLAALRLRHGSQNTGWLGAGISAVLLAPLARLTVLPYAAAIFVFIVTIALIRQTRSAWRSSIAILTITGATVFLVCLRTFQQTGVAFASPDVLVDLQGFIGWTLHDDIGRYVPMFRTPFPDGLIDSLFGPAAYVHQALFWMGNGWLPLMIAALAMHGWKWVSKPETLFMLLVGISMYVLLYAYRYGNDGADGNYFIVPIVLLHIAVWSGAFRNEQASTVTKPVICGAIAIIAFSLFVVLTTANWIPGTRRLDARFNRLPFAELQSLADARFRISGMRPLADELARWPSSTRMLGDMPVADGGYFPVSYESLGTIAWARPSLLADDTTIRLFFRDHGIRLVALAHDPVAGVDGRVRPVLDNLVRQGEARKLNVNGGPADLWWLDPAPTNGPASNIGDRTWR